MSEISGYAPIVFLSTIDEARNKNQISKEWFTENSRVLYSNSANQQLEEWVNQGLLEKEGNEYKAKFGDKFQEIFKNNSNNALESLNVNLDLFVNLLNREWMRQDVLNIDTIVKVFDGQADKARDNFFRIFQTIALSLIEYRITEKSSEVSNSEIVQNLGGIVGKIIASMAGPSQLKIINKKTVNAAKQNKEDECLEEFIEEVIVDMVPGAS